MIYPWQGLFFKEWKMMRVVIFAAFLIGLAALMLSRVLLAVDLMNIGLVFTPFYVIYSLNAEANQIQAFLYQPNSANKMLLTKVSTGIACSAIFQAMLLLIFLGSVFFFGTGGISHSGFMLYCSLAILVISLLPTAVFIFIWTIYHWLKGKIGQLGFPVAIIVMVIFVICLVNFWDTDLFSQLTHWGKISIMQDLSDLPGELQSYAGGFYIGVVLFHAVIIAIMYSMSCWLIDRKVGV